MFRLLRKIPIVSVECISTADTYNKKISTTTTNKNKNKTEAKVYLKSL